MAVDQTTPPKRVVPPSRFQRTITDPATRSLTLLSATDGGISVGPTTSQGQTVGGYLGGINFFCEKLSLYVPGDGASAFSTEGCPLRVRCANIEVLSMDKPAILSTEGADGTPQTAKSGTTPGMKNGRPAADIEIYVEHMSLALAKTLVFSAKGGKGADLGPEAKEAGGNGGRGGEITAFWRFSLHKAHQVLLNVHRDLNLPKNWTDEDELQADTLGDDHVAIQRVRSMSEDMRQITFSHSQTEELVPLLEPLESLVWAPIPKNHCPKNSETGLPVRSVYRLTAAMNKTANRFQEAIKNTRIELTTNSLVRGGAAGKREDLGLDRGLLGEDGAPGSSHIENLGPGSKTDVFKVPFVFAHPLQCSMLFDKASVYFYLGSAANRQKAKDILETIIDRLSFATPDFVNAMNRGNVSQPLLQAHLSFFGSLQGAQKCAQELNTLYTKAVNMYIQITSTPIDYYGYPEDYVPRTSYDAFDEMMESAIGELERTEDVFLRYLNEKEGKGTLDVHIATVSKMIHATIEDSKRALAEQNAVLKKKYISVSDNSRKDEIILAREQAEVAMKRLQDSISGHFEISPKSMLNGLVNFASGPSAALGAAQGASLLYEGFTSVPNTSGDPISKDLLIKTLKKGGDSVGSLKKEMLSLDDKTDGSLAIDTQFSTKILTSIASVDGLIDEFADGTFGPSAEEARTTLRKYSQLLIARNDDLVEYNLMLKKSLATMAEITQLERSRTQLQQDKFASEFNTAEDLDGMARLLEKIFENRRARVMKQLSLLQRSLRYKTLSSVDFIDDAWCAQARNDPQIEEAALSMTSQVLRDLKSSLSDQLFKVKEKKSADVSLFPTNFESGGLGKLHHLTKAEVAELLAKGAVRVTVPVVDALADLKYERSSEFRACADVRVYRVRFWLRGLKLREGSAPLGPMSQPHNSLSGKLFGGGKLVTVKLTHGGQETIVGTDNRRWRFRHEPLSVTFSYRLYPDGGYEIGDATSGDVVNFSSTAREVNSVYAAPSPFTEWKVSLLDLNTDDIDVSGVEEAIVEFFGSYRSFEENRK